MVLLATMSPAFPLCGTVIAFIGFRHFSFRLKGLRALQPWPTLPTWLSDQPAGMIHSTIRQPRAQRSAALFLSSWLLRLPGSGGDKRGGELFVEGEEVFATVPVAGERLGPVTAVHRPVQLLMCLEQRRGHRQRVIQICQRRGWILRLRVQHRLSRRFLYPFQPGNLLLESIPVHKLAPMGQIEQQREHEHDQVSVLGRTVVLLIRTNAYMKVIRHFLLAMGLAACLPLQTPAAEGSLTPEAKADFEWFSGLGFPDVKNASFARVATGGWSQSGGIRRKRNYLLGFLLSTNGNAFTTLDMDLFQHTFTVSAARDDGIQAGWVREDCVEGTGGDASGLL